MCVNLVLLAKGTAFDIAADEGSKAGPPEFGGNQLPSFQEAGVSGGFMIVAMRKDGVAEGVVGGDVDPSFVSEDTGLNLPVSKAGTEGKRDVFVHGLKGLEDKGVTRRSGFDPMRESSVD